MKRSDRELFAICVALLGLVLLVTSGCKAHFESEQQTHATVAEQLDQAQQVDTNIVEAPGSTTTTVEEFGAWGDAKWGGPGAAPAGQVAPTPRLLKRTVTVAKHGAVTIDQHAAAKSQERDDSTLDEQHKAKESFGFLSNPLTWIGAGVVLLGVGYAALKLRKVVPV